jgi:hypothetical protein
MSAAYDTIESLSTELRVFTLVAKASGSPITAGTVNWYLQALTGANAGKWWKTADATWAASETANAMTHVADGHWKRDPVASATSPWTDGVEFLEYAKESGDLHIPGARKVKAAYTPAADSSQRVTVGSLAAAAIQSIWDAATSALTTAGSIGKMLVDKLNGVSGQVASQAEVLAIQNNTRVRVIVPPTMERPDAGTFPFELDLYIYDGQGAMEVPDSTPTITAKNQAGTDRSANLSAVTNPSTGKYKATYTMSVGDSIEQLVFEWSIVEGGQTRLHGATSQVVDTTAVDFTSSDRTTLNAIAANADVATSSRLATAGYTAPDNASIASILGKLSGITSLANWIRAGFRKLTPDATALSEINSGGGSYDATTDALQAIRDRGDAAWTTGGGGGGGSDPLENPVPGSYAAGTAGYVLGTLQGMEVNIVSPVAEDGDVTIVRGDDYLAADGRALDFVNAAGTWPNLTSAVIVLTARRRGCSALGPVAGSVITATGPNQKVRVELTHTLTGSLAPAPPAYRYDVQATLSDGSIVTLQLGDLEVTEDVSP